MNANIKSIFASLVLALVGCAPKLAPTIDAFNYKGFHFKSEVALSEKAKERIAYDIETIKIQFDARGLIAAKDFDHAFGDTYVHITATQYIDKDNDVGDFEWGSQLIVVPESGGALAHELLHKWEWDHFNLLDMQHQHWATNGYFKADNSMVHLHLNWTCSFKDYAADMNQFVPFICVDPANFNDAARNSTN